MRKKTSMNRGNDGKNEETTQDQLHGDDDQFGTKKKMREKFNAKMEIYKSRTKQFATTEENVCMYVCMYVWMFV